MSSRSQHYGFQSATMVQPANGGHAYLFGNNGSENDLSEEDGEIYELRPRGRERLRRSTSRERMDDIIYLSRDIQEGDTLNSISLQYHCSVRLDLRSVCVEFLCSVVGRTQIFLSILNETIIFLLTRYMKHTGSTQKGTPGNVRLVGFGHSSGHIHNNGKMPETFRRAMTLEVPGCNI